MVNLSFKKERNVKEVFPPQILSMWVGGKLEERTVSFVAAKMMSGRGDDAPSKK